LPDFEIEPINTDDEVWGKLIGPIDGNSKRDGVQVFFDHRPLLLCGAKLY
jgi:hypothetical protein